MPRASVLANASRFPDLQQLVRLKKFWTVSGGALAYRLHDLGLITDWHYRRLCMDIATRGYRTREPQEAQRESSQVLTKVFAALRDEGVTRGHIAQELHIRPEEIDGLVFGLTLTGLGGSVASPAIARKRPQLRVVK